MDCLNRVINNDSNKVFEDKNYKTDYSYMEKKYDEY